MLGPALRLGHDRRGIVHVSDRERLDPGFDRGSRESMIGHHEIRSFVGQHPTHRLRPVGVPRPLPVRDHADRAVVGDRPLLAGVIVEPGLAVGRSDDLGAAGRRELGDCAVQRIEVAGVPGGEQHPLATARGARQTLPHPLARVHHGSRVDVGRSLRSPTRRSARPRPRPRSARCRRSGRVRACSTDRRACRDRARRASGCSRTRCDVDAPPVPPPRRPRGRAPTPPVDTAAAPSARRAPADDRRGLR